MQKLLEPYVTQVSNQNSLATITITIISLYFINLLFPIFFYSGFQLSQSNFPNLWHHTYLEVACLSQTNG